MEELSLHILDIVQNSIKAGADTIKIIVDISAKMDQLMIQIQDNGAGMSTEMAKKVLDPFTTTRTTRHVGLGLPLFKEAAEQTEGHLQLTSKEGEGTTVQAIFQLNHIDRAPLGNIQSTIITLIQGNPEIDFIYIHRFEENEYELNTKLIRQELDGVPIQHHLVLQFIRDDLEDGLKDLLLEE